MSLAKRAVRGAAWTLPTSLVSRAIGLVGTLLLARYLLPADYGEVSAAVIIVTTASSLTTFGIGVYLVSNPGAPRDEAFHATLLYNAIGFVMILAALALSRPLGRWFEAPDVGRFMPLLALGTMLDRISYIPERTLVRRLRFAPLSIGRALAELTYTGVSVGLAAAGLGAMAIVWGNLARSALRFGCFVGAAQLRDWLEPSPIRASTARKLLSFGVSVSLMQGAYFAIRRWDNLLISRFFGPGVMGAYNYAYNLADTPAVAVGEQMTDVITASFPHLEPERRADALLRSCVLVSLIMFPLAVGLGAVSPSIVSTFFNEKWTGIAPMLMILSVLSLLRPISSVLGAYLLAVQRPGVLAVNYWLALGLMVALIWFIHPYGIGPTCAAVGGVFFVSTLMLMSEIGRLEGLGIAQFLVPLAPTAAACVPLYLAVLGARHLVHDAAPPLRLAIEVGAGAAGYVIGVLTVARPVARELWRLVRSNLLKRS